jgi:hypothetical protein
MTFKINSYEEYGEMARRTRETVKGLDVGTEQRQLLEAALGLSGEAAELLIEVLPSAHKLNSYSSGLEHQESIITELGDSEWYAQEFQDVLEKYYQLDRQALSDAYGPNLEISAFIQPQMAMLILAGLIGDAVKKHVMYRKPLDTNLVVGLFANYCYYRDEFVNLYYRDTGKLWEARSRNITKLAKRYNLPLPS